MLIVFLRMVGSFSLTAIFFVFVPYENMNNIHQLLGMGELPAEPVVGYLARSLSAFYALVGGIMWVVSFDIKQHLAVIRYLGAALTIFGDPDSRHRYRRRYAGVLASRLRARSFCFLES